MGNNYETDDTKRSVSIFHSIPWILGWASLTVIGPIMFLKVAFKAFQIVFNLVMKTEDKLCGKVIMITGASSGLGEALAHVLYNRGCRLILASRDTTKLHKLKDTLINSYKPPELHLPIVLNLDLEDINQIPRTINNLLSTVSHVDVLINNAGISYRGSIAATDISVDIKLMVVNYFGQIALTKALLPSMIKRNCGHIIGISSIQGKLPLPYRSCYGASKHAFQSFLDCLRAEVSDYNIKVTVVNPGYIATNLSMNAVTEDGSKHNVMDATTAGGMSPEAVANEIALAIINPKPEITLCPMHHKLIILMKLLFPSAFNYLMKRRAHKQRLLYTNQEKNKNI